MRRDGDRLLSHLASARDEVLLCAPFIKAGVLSNLLRQVDLKVRVRVVTRWLPAEVAVKVSDLEVYDVLAARDGAELHLFDRLHAKLYVADGRVLAGSANLTANALGWSPQPNLELLTELSPSDEAVTACLAELAQARPATEEERDRIRELARAIGAPALNLAEDVELSSAPTLWLPQSGAPNRLFQAYMPRTRERLSASVLETAMADLEALGVPPGLTEPAFVTFVTDAFQRMPAIVCILEAAAGDLTDAGGADIIGQMGLDAELAPETRWLIVREWLTHFLGDRYEIAPQSFVLRLRAGAGR